MRQEDYLSVKQAIAQFKKDNNINPFTLKPINSYEKTTNYSTRNQRRDCKNATNGKSIL